MFLYAAYYTLVYSNVKKVEFKVQELTKYVHLSIQIQQKVENLKQNVYIF